MLPEMGSEGSSRIVGKHQNLGKEWIFFSLQVWGCRSLFNSFVLLVKSGLFYVWIHGVHIFVCLNPCWYLGIG